MSVKNSNNGKISVHHIGGRAGSRPFPVIDKFERDIINVLYDADVDCLEQIKAVNQKLGSELHVLPYCVSDVCKKTSININYDPYTSSVYDLNPEFDSYYVRHNSHDYVFSEALKSMEKREVDAVNLDYIFQKPENCPPDFLSMDVQGSEYDILLGGRETIQKSVVGIVVEAEFIEIYKGQRLFGDLFNLLHGMGFNLVRFLDMIKASPFRASEGLRGDNFLVAGDILFLRRIKNIEEQCDEFQRYLMLRKLAFICILFNQFEYGLQCLNRSREIAEGTQYMATMGDVSYLTFLTELEQRLERMPKIFPGTFTSQYKSFAESKSRFDVQYKAVSPKGLKRMLYDHVPILFVIWRRIRKIRKQMTTTINTLMDRYTDLEQFLIHYGLREQANVLRRERKSKN